jgi:hypothetical protein
MPSPREFVVGPWRAVSVPGITQILSWGAPFYPPVLTAPSVASDHDWSRSFAMAGFSIVLFVGGLCSRTIGGAIDRLGGCRDAGWLAPWRDRPCRAGAQRGRHRSLPAGEGRHQGRRDLNNPTSIRRGPGHYGLASVMPCAARSFGKLSSRKNKYSRSRKSVSGSSCRSCESTCPGWHMTRPPSGRPSRKSGNSAA